MKKITLSFLLSIAINYTNFAQGIWQKMTSPVAQTLNACAVIDGATAYFVGNNGTILKTDDGDTINQQISNTANDLFGVCFLNSNIGWAVGFGGTVVKTTDGGTNWIVVPNTGGQFNNIQVLLSVKFGNFNTGWAVGMNTIGNSVVLKTTDGGNNWSTQNYNSGGLWFVDVPFNVLNPTNAIAVGLHTTTLNVGITTNGGSNWNPSAGLPVLDFTLSEDLKAVQYIDANNVIAIGDDYPLIISTDGGNNWTKRTSPLPAGGGGQGWINSASFIDINIGFAVGQSSNIFRTTDGGFNWTSQDLAATDLTIGNIDFVDFPLYPNVNFMVGWAVGSGVGGAGVIVKYTHVPVTSVAVTGTGGATTISTYAGTLQMIANVQPVNATNKNVTWSVNPGTGNASIDANGLLTAVSDGTVTVTATSVDNPTISGNIEITISNQIVAVTGVTVSGENNATSISTNVGTLQMLADVYPANASDTSVVWSVSPVGIANISVDGLLTALNNGTVKVKVVSVSNPAISDSIEITISNQMIAVTGITVSGENNVNTIDTKGGTLQMIADVQPANASDTSVVWSVSPVGIANISVDGLLAALNDGKVKVKAVSVSNPAISDSIEITVSNQVIANNAPVLYNIEPTPVSWYDSNTNSITSTLTITDADDVNLAGASIQILDFQGSDELIFTNQNNISGFYGIYTGTLTLIGTATIADYQTALHSIRFSTPIPLAKTTALDIREISFSVTDGKDNSNSQNRTIKDIPLGINDPLTSASISVSPNPGNTNIKIKSAVNLGKEATISIMDIRGQKVYQDLFGEGTIKTIDISEFSQGIYVIRIQTGKYNFVQKINKQ